MPTSSMTTPVIPGTSNDEVDQLLIESPLALLVGMLLDQHIG
jgi:hypothetical protein